MIIAAYAVASVLVLLLIWLLARKPAPYKPRPKPQNTCQCGHAKCFHAFGSSVCNKDFCDCCKYTPIEVESAKDPELEQLKKMTGIQ